ncbi:unnamed protein product [Toxocara canis]|uniref:Uncharacterized protein n=1 Tax=Toxocara canis TaxID=6265 RepID=A0A3P7GUU1_TOXCA|nr:unnamed protein product [Toxocara canis]
MYRGEKLTSSTPTTSTTSTTSATSIVPTTTTAVINVKKPQTILAVMRAFAERTNAVGVEGLRGDFAKLQQRGPHPPKMSVTAQKQNRAKCRYFDIPCLDETRVILKPWPNTSGDFIHANWVGHELIDNKFICTQAPLDNTAGDFWRMLWQEKVDLILMLCRVTEAGKQKCALYWPNNVGETKTFCGITIKNEAIRNKDPDIWGTDMLVSYGGEQRKITHYQWITWPDKFVPQQLVVPFILLSLARTRKQPTIIHCSAGIGRTGTLVALEVVIRALMKGSDLSISDIIWSLRSQRSKFVQTEEQFLYMHYIVIQRLVNKGILPDRIASKFCRDYEHYYFSKTHMVQVPLPIFVRKRVVTQSKRRTVEKVPIMNTNEDANKVLDRRSKCLAINDETLAALRMSFDRRVRLLKAKKAPVAENAAAKEALKAPDSTDVVKAVKHTIEVMRQFQASMRLPDTMQQQYEQAIQALQTVQLITEQVKNGAPANADINTAASVEAANTSSQKSVTAVSTTTKTPVHASGQTKPSSDEPPNQARIIRAPSLVNPVPGTHQTTSPAPMTASTVPPATLPTISSNISLDKANEKGAEAKREDSPGNMVVEVNGTKENEEDEDFSAGYVFMQPEWANIYPAERKRAPETIEEYYADESLAKNTVIANLFT